jgi:hypothetical protein
MTNLVKFASALALTSFLSGAPVAYAGNPNGTDQNGTDQNGTGQNEAPMPLLAATPFALAALGGTLVFSMRRKAKAAA